MADAQETIDRQKLRSKTEEFRQEFTKKIISLMEQGEAFWQKPWKCPAIQLPYNAASGKRYNGVNVAYLLDAATSSSFSDPRWMTYKQAEEKGYQVRKGEHGTKIEYYGEYDPTRTRKGAENLDRKIRGMRDQGASQEEMARELGDRAQFFVRTYTVFNASQIDGIEPFEAESTGPGEAFRFNDRAEGIMDHSGVSIQYGMSAAFYRSATDTVGLPNREWFSSPEYFYATALHEIAHSTGHPSRMDRQGLGKSFGSPEYAMEELRAEMASAFVFREIGVPLSPESMEEHTKDHAAYTQHWLKALKDDYREFYRAVRDAVKIADYVMAYEHVQESVNAPTVAENRTNDAVQAAKSILGQNAVVTNAQPGKTYIGEILHVGTDLALQKIGTGMGILHDLNKLDNPQEVLALRELPKDDRRVAIAYDGERRPTVEKVGRSSRETERETAFSR